MKRVLLFCCSILTLLLSCDVGVYRESLIHCYLEIDPSGEAISYKEASSVKVVLPTSMYAQCLQYEPTREEERVWKEKHQELSLQYSDIGFNAWTALDYPFIGCWAFPFKAFDVVSNADYDDVHLAGVSLNDIVEITYTTHKYFIETGYKHTDANRSVNDYSGDWVTKRLSELQPEDSIFMEAGYFSLRFVEQPTAAQSHTFTVTVEFEHGEPYSFSFDMDFPSAE